MNITDRLTEVYKAKYDDLVRMYKSRAGANDVEDLIQEAFYRALLYKDSFREGFTTIECWLTSIIGNCLRDLKREKNNGKAMHLEEIDEVIQLSRCPSDVDLENKILGDIATKRGNTRQILWLYFALGERPIDIHRIVGGSLRNIEHACLRFRRECQERYGHLMED